MLTLVPNNSNQPRRRGGSPRVSKGAKDVRTQTLRAIHATWRKICPLEGEELRDARLEFATQALGVKKPLKSMSKLSSAQLGRILDAMRERERTPALPGVEVRGSGSPPAPRPLTPDPSPTSGDIIHLATDAQVEALRKLFRYLKWSAIGTQAFLVEKFKRTNEAMLTPAQANSCTMILLTIAARKRIKERIEESGPVAVGKISRERIHAEIPALKRELGIDQSAARARRGSFGSNDDYDDMVKGAAFKHDD